MSDSPPPEPPIIPNEPVRKIRRWLRLIRWSLSVSLFALLLARAGLPFLLPLACRGVGQALGLKIRYSDYSLSALAGDLRVHDLRLEVEDSVNAFELPLLHVELEPIELLFGRLTFSTLTLDSARLHLSRDFQSLVESIPTMVSSSLAQRAANTAPAKALHIESFALPIILRSAILRDFRLVLSGADPAAEPGLRVDIWASNLAIPTGLSAARFDLALSAPGVFGAVRISLEGHCSARELSCSWEAKTRQLVLYSLRDLLTPIGLEPSPQLLWNLEAKGHFRLGLAAHRADALSLQVTLERARITAASGPAFELARAELHIAELGLGGDALALHRLSLEGWRLELNRNPTGQLYALGLRLRRPVAATAASLDGSSSNSAAEAAKPSRLNRLVLENLSLYDMETRLVDAAYPDRPGLLLRMPYLTARDLSLAPVEGQRTMRLEAQFIVPGLTRELQISASGRLGMKRTSLAGNVAMRGVKSEALSPYLEAIGLRSALRDGELELSGLSADLAFSKETVLADLSAGPIRWSEGSEELFRVKGASSRGLKIDLERRHINLGAVTIDGLDLSARMAADGSLGAVGVQVESRILELWRSPASTHRERPESASADVSNSAAKGGGSAPTLRGAPWTLSLSDFNFVNGSASLDNDRYPDMGRLGIEGLGFRLRDLFLVLGAEDPQAAGPEGAPFSLDFALPGLAEKLALRGRVLADARSPKLEIEIQAFGINLQRIEPLLAKTPLRSVIENGTFLLRFECGAIIDEGSVTAFASVPTLRLAQAAKKSNGSETAQLMSLFEVDGARIRATILPQRNDQSLELRIDELKCDRTAILVALEERASLVALGLAWNLERSSTWNDLVDLPEIQTILAESAADRELSSLVNPKLLFDQTTKAIQSLNELLATLPDFDLQLPKVELSRLEIRFEDRVEGLVSRDEVFVSTDFGPLRLDPKRSLDFAEVPLQLTLQSPRLLSEAHFKGAASSTAGSLHVSIEAKGRGFEPRRLQEFLKPMGVRALLRDGRFAGKAELCATLGRTIGLDFKLREFSITEPDRSWVTIDAVHWTGLSLDRERIALGHLTIQNPSLRVERRDDRALVLAGFAFKPDPAPEPESLDSEFSLPVLRIPRLPEIALSSLNLRSVSIDLIDAVSSPPLILQPSLDLTLNDLALTSALNSGKLDLLLSIPGLLASGRIHGPIALSSTSLGAQLNVDFFGLSLEPLRPRLPKSLQGEFPVAQLRFKLLAKAQALEEDRVAARLRLTKFDWREVDSVEPWLALKDLDASLIGYDPRAEIFGFERVALKGLRARVERASDGTLAAAGFRYLPGAPPQNQSGKKTKKSTKPKRAAGAKIPRLPFLSIEKLDLGVERLDFVEDEAQHTTSIQGLRLTNRQRLELFGRDGESLRPLAFRLEGSVAPLVSAIAIDIDASPFARRPQLDLTVQLDAIRGAGLERWLVGRVPALAAVPVSNGSLTGKFHAELFNIERAGPLDVSFLARPFGLGVELQNWRYLDKEQPEEAISLENLELDLSSLHIPSRALRVRRLDLQGLTLAARRELAGLHFGGGLWSLPVAAPSASATPTSAPQTGLITGLQTARWLAELPDWQIEAFTLREIRVNYSDRSLRPPMSLPLVLDEISLYEGISTRELRNGQSIKLNLQAHGEEAALPLSERGLTTILRSEQRGFRRAASEKSTEKSTEKSSEATGPSARELRPILGAARIDTDFALAPKLTGRFRIELEGAELTAIEGLAASKKVLLRQGTLDFMTRAFLGPDQTLELNQRYRFVDLDVSEDDGGSIQQALGLTTPINQVAFLLRDSDGVISLPVSLSIERDKISTSEVTGLILLSLGRLMARSVGNVPGRILAQIGDFLPRLPWDIPYIGTRKLPSLPLLEVTCLPGDASLRPDHIEALQPYVRAARDHPGAVLWVELAIGSEDLRVLEDRASPPQDDALALLARTRQRIGELELEREVLASEARMAFSLALTEQAKDIWQRLSQLDTSIGDALQIEAQLDVLVSPRGARNRQGRIVEATQALLREREAALRQAVIEIGGGGRYERALRLRRVRDPQAKQGRIRLAFEPPRGPP